MSEQDLYPVPDDLGLGATVRGFIEGQRLFDRYVLQRILGRGGMGVVWLAHDEHLQEDVALKFLPELVRLDTVSIEELKRETRRSRKLAHPNIVKVYDFTADAATAAISMEYVEGETLSALRARQEHLCFDADAVAAWTYQICAALAYAHGTAKIVHRDLKPANVMLDREGQVKVTDFGISSSISESVSRVTVKPGTSGTLAYMSPQQARGMAPSAGDDIYALGATLFELLTGKPPFYRGEIMHQLLNEPVPSLAQRRADLGVVGAPIPEIWENTVTACLAKEPVDRPKSVVEVVERLGLGTLGGYALPPVTDPPPSAPEVAPLPEPPPKSSGNGLLIAGVAIGVLVLGGLGYYFGIYQPREQAREAAIAQQEAIEKQKEAEAQAAVDAAKKAELKQEAQKAAAAAEALRTQQEKQQEESERLANARGGLMVNTNPPGATVALGGEDVQTSPATFKSVKLGSYPLHITLDGYEPIDQTAEIKESEFADLGTITLVRSKGNLQIVTTPPDANYAINNTALGINQSGKAPDTIKDLPVGTYDVTVTRGDWTIPGTATIKRNDTVVYNSEFTYGSVALTSDPAGADVTENGKNLGKTPITLKDLRTGSHTFALMLPGYQNSSVLADVGTNAVVTASATLQKILLGSVRITSEPSGATVSEHGSELGQTPLTLSGLSPGKHMYTFALSGYKSTSASTQVAVDTVSDVSTTLEKKLSLAGTWTGTISEKGDYYVRDTREWNILVSADETSVSSSWDSIGTAPMQSSAQREGDTLTWSMAQLPGDNGAPGQWRATCSLKLSGEGKATFICNWNHFAGDDAGESSRAEGTLTRQ
jgi:hypothetical protein